MAPKPYILKYRYLDLWDSQSGPSPGFRQNISLKDYCRYIKARSTPYFKELLLYGGLT